MATADGRYPGDGAEPGGDGKRAFAVAVAVDGEYTVKRTETLGAFI